MNEGYDPPNNSRLDMSQPRAIELSHPVEIPRQRVRYLDGVDHFFKHCPLTRPSK